MLELAITASITTEPEFWDAEDERKAGVKWIDNRKLKAVFNKYCHELFL